MKRLSDPAVGIVYAVFAVIGTILLVKDEIDGATNDEIITYYGDSGNRTSQGIGTTLMLVATGAFLWFVSVLWSRLRSAGARSRVLANLGFAAGVVAAALFAAAAILLNATATAVEVSDRFVVDPNLARFAVSTGYLFLVGSALANCVLVAVTSVLARRSDVLPGWLGLVGAVAVVLAILEAFLLPVFVIPIWVAIVSIVMLRSTPATDQRAGERNAQVDPTVAV